MFSVLCLVGKSSSGKFGCPFCSASSPYDEDGELYTLGTLLDLHKVTYQALFVFECLRRRFFQIQNTVVSEFQYSSKIYFLFLPPQLFISQFHTAPMWYTFSYWCFLIAWHLRYNTYFWADDVAYEKKSLCFSFNKMFPQIFDLRPLYSFPGIKFRWLR